MKNLFVIAGMLAIAGAALPCSAFAQSTPYTSYSGGQNASTPGGAVPPTVPAAPLVPAPTAAPAGTPAKPPLTNSVTTTTAPAPAGATTTDTSKVDPCKDYMYDINAYNMCTDRMQKIQRMIDAKKSRDSVYLPPPAPAPAPAAAPAAAPATNTTTPAAAPTNTTTAPAPPPAATAPAASTPTNTTGH